MQPTSKIANLSFESYLALFEKHGGTDANYLQTHFTRFHNTYLRLASTWNKSDNQTVVDVGAHFLHQALMYAVEGFHVEAINLPTTFKKAKVKNLAEAYGINLIPSEDLEQGTCFDSLSDNTADLILFTEILEHIAFNPISFWTEVYRILKPGGRILVTTPNYYSIAGRAWDIPRFLGGLGGGITVNEILEVNTYGHHWKEFSMKEVQAYFRLLSPDFVCLKSLYTDDRGPGTPRESKVSEWLMGRIENFRPNLHLEIGLMEKEVGIAIKPNWSKVKRQTT
ncbi:MAG: class I SAM-dependent methyltransferase [Pseudomonadota bacterium]